MVEESDTRLVGQWGYETGSKMAELMVVKMALRMAECWAGLRVVRMVA